ncbi:MAG: CoA transferase [Rhodoferax sp.]|nr:CoA transferase [Rhodoferax sp.]
MNASTALDGLWRLAGLPHAALAHVHLTGADPVLPSSFHVGAAAQASIAAAALAACELGHLRGAARQDVTVDMTHAAMECMEWFSLDGRVPDLWDPFSGLYACADGWVRIHANFLHHRQGALRVMGLNPETAQRADADAAMRHWRAVDFETAAANAGLVATAVRTFDAWDDTPQAQAIDSQPLFTISRIGDAPPRALPALSLDALPLQGVRVLDLTRILAGPVGGRALAAYGADVLMINAPHLPNIEAIAVTSRGKLSAHADLRQPEGREVMNALLADAHVMVQGYRPGGLRDLGFGPQDAAARSPGVVYVSLTAYGAQGPWAMRRGFDSLLQSAMGFNLAEGDGTPRALPMQILDQATGYLIALGAVAALVRQQQEGGSWHVEVSLAQTAHWLRGMGRVAGGLAAKKPDDAPYRETSASGFGVLQSLRHSAHLSRTPARWVRPSMPPGSHMPQWP